MTVRNTAVTGEEYIPVIMPIKDTKFFSRYSGKPGSPDAVRFEVYSGSLQIDKYRLHFQKLHADASGTAMNQVFTIDIYINKDEAMVLGFNILTGRLTADKNGVYYHTAPMGTSSADLAARNKSRPSGASEFRQFQIRTSSLDNYQYYISAMSCDAVMNGNGLFAPMKDQKGRLKNLSSAGIPLTAQDLRDLAILFLTEGISYKSGQWAVNAINQSINDIIEETVKAVVSRMLPKDSRENAAAKVPEEQAQQNDEDYYVLPESYDDVSKENHKEAEPVLRIDSDDLPF